MGGEWGAGGRGFEEGDEEVETSRVLAAAPGAEPALRVRAGAGWWEDGAHRGARLVGGTTRLARRLCEQRVWREGGRG